MAEERYIVMIDDNFHYMDEDHRYKHGEFSTYAQGCSTLSTWGESEMPQGPEKSP